MKKIMGLTEQRSETFKLKNFHLHPNEQLQILPSAAANFLKQAQGISAWSCGLNTLAIGSRDLDLYGKSYKLINSGKAINESVF